ncbi:MAG TPA: hypothetical protein VGB04_06755 [Allosphingosinicella sp.]|jgi:hypothetical protein
MTPSDTIVDKVQAGVEAVARAASAAGQPQPQLSHPALATGAQSLGQVVLYLDSLSMRIVAMPDLGESPIDGAAAHVARAKALANGWMVETRPGLIRSMGALKDFGSSIIERWAPTLRTEFAGGSSPQAMAQARELLGSISHTLQAVAAQWQGTVAGVGDWMTQIEAVAGALQSDAAAASQRAFADQQTVTTLNQQAADLQNKISEAQNRENYYWLLGPLGGLLAREIDSLASNLNGLLSQIGDIKADIDARITEEHTLQALMPAITGYVQAAQLMGATANGMTATIQLLVARLIDVRVSVDSSPDVPVFAAAQLDSTVADWQEVADSVGQIPQTAPA